jgi:hypothetical protein
MRTQTRLLAFALFLAANCASLAHAAADKPDAAVTEALGGLESWLRESGGLAGWSTYLNLPGLQAELTKGNSADLAVLKVVEKNLQSGAPGLDLPRFKALREALENWTAELAIVQAPSLPAAVLAAEANFRPITEADVAVSKAALAAAAAKLDAYLTGSNGAAWKKYLQWTDMQAQLKAEKPDLELLATLYRKLTADQVGLEMPVFANVADSLERYINDAAAHADDKLQAQFNEQLKSLAAALEQYVKAPNDDTAQAIGSRLGWLESRRQTPALVSAIRSQLSRTNLKVSASERLVGAGIRQSLDEVTPVQDYILGTSIRGTGHMVGTVTVELVPSEDRAKLDTMLSGIVNSRTIGVNGPATIHSNGTTAIAGRKRIVIDDLGFASYPATATANTSTHVTGIGGSGIVQRVASRRVDEQKAQAERIAADHAAHRVRERMDKQVNQQMAEAHANFHKKVRNPLLRRRELPDLGFRTTEDYLLVNMLAANRNQIAAPTAPPEVKVASDLAVQIHESTINNLAESLFGGVTLEEEDLQKRVIEMRGSLPDSLKSDEERDPWSITFARTQPVTVKITDGAVSITIRGQRYTSGDQDFRAMNVTADYKVSLTEPNAQGIRGIKLVRQGDLKIVPPGEPRRLSGREITLRTLLERRFGKLFEPEIVYDGLILPGNWRQAGILDTKQLDLAGGWAVVAWLESGVPAPPEEKKPDAVKTVAN